MEHHAETLAENVLAIDLRNISKRFGEVHALRDISLSVAKGEAFSLVGPSGCGKTTLLNIIAGLLDPDCGEILLMGRSGTALSPRDRGAIMVFQNYALFPHLTVFENIVFGLRIRKVALSMITQRAKAVLEVVGLSGKERYYPYQLSGGQQQRVALARALIVEPPILLLDEPMSNLDARLRDQVRFELREILQRLSVTSIFVTHDIHEAFILSDRMAVMNEGSITQIGTAKDLYEHPANPFVASFVGMCNVLGGQIVKEDDEMIAVQLDIDAGVLVRAKSIGKDIPGQRVDLYIRPERVSLRKKVSRREDDLQGKILRATYLGSEIEYLVDVGGTFLRAHSRAGETELFRCGEEVLVNGVRGMFFLGSRR